MERECERDTPPKGRNTARMDEVISNRTVPKITNEIKSKVLLEP